eukprot:CFRG6624T1
MQSFEDALNVQSEMIGSYDYNSTNLNLQEYLQRTHTLTHGENCAPDSPDLHTATSRSTIVSDKQNSHMDQHAYQHQDAHQHDAYAHYDMSEPADEIEIGAHVLVSSDDVSTGHSQQQLGHSPSASQQAYHMSRYSYQNESAPEYKSQQYPQVQNQASGDTLNNSNLSAATQPNANQFQHDASVKDDAYYQGSDDGPHHKQGYYQPQCERTDYGAPNGFAPGPPLGSVLPDRELSNSYSQERSSFQHAQEEHKYRSNTHVPTLQTAAPQPTHTQLPGGLPLARSHFEAVPPPPAAHPFNQPHSIPKQRAEASYVSSPSNVSASINGGHVTRSSPKIHRGTDQPNFNEGMITHNSNENNTNNHVEDVFMPSMASRSHSLKSTNANSATNLSSRSLANTSNKKYSGKSKSATAGHDVTKSESSSRSYNGRRESFNTMFGEAVKRKHGPCTFPDCGKYFRFNSNLLDHIRSHTGERPYRCTRTGCGKAFTTSSHLARHTRTHSQDRPYACTVVGCGKRFKVAGHLRRHMNVHKSDETPALKLAAKCRRASTPVHVQKKQNTPSRQRNDSTADHEASRINVGSSMSASANGVNHFPCNSSGDPLFSQSMPVAQQYHQGQAQRYQQNPNAQQSLNGGSSLYQGQFYAGQDGSEVADGEDMSGHRGNTHLVSGSSVSGARAGTSVVHTTNNQALHLQEINQNQQYYEDHVTTNSMSSTLGPSSASAMNNMGEGRDANPMYETTQPHYSSTGEFVDVIGDNTYQSNRDSQQLAEKQQHDTQHGHYQASHSVGHVHNQFTYPPPSYHQQMTGSVGGSADQEKCASPHSHAYSHQGHPQQHSQTQSQQSHYMSVRDSSPGTEEVNSIPHPHRYETMGLADGSLQQAAVSDVDVDVLDDHTFDGVFLGHAQYENQTSRVQ